jgi:3-keto-disaccharide hydrolase
MRTPVALPIACAWLLVGAVAVLPAQQSSTAPPPARDPRIPAIFVPPEPLDDSDHEGWTALFDGSTLKGWDGNPEVWKVENGAITAVSTAERRIGSTHLVWQGGEFADFELKLEVKLDGDIHSGIAYRSQIDLNRGAGGRAVQPAAAPSGSASAPPPPARGRGTPPQVPANPKWTLYGPGLDYDYDRLMAGNVEDRGTDRRELAWRGSIVRAEAGKRPRVIGSLGDPAALMELFKVDDWNQVHIVARGNQLTHIVNGRVMTILIDDDPAFYKRAGLIGLQIEQYGLGRVSVRNIWLKKV